jgi:hypothetical protein
MDKSLTYYKPINSYFRKVNLDEWFLSRKAYEEGDYYQALLHLLRYINPPISIPDTSSLDLKIPHGSVNVHIKADQKTFSVDIPFLKFTPQSKKLPAMRQMIEQNFSSLILGQIILQDSELWFHYDEPIEKFEPYKIYYILDEICIEADRNDDYYIDRFQLEHVQKPEIQLFTEGEVNQASEIFKNLIQEGLQLAEYFENKRYYNATCDILAITFFRIRHVIFPQGILGRELIDALNSMYANDSMANIIHSTKAKFNKFLTYDFQKFKESLFHPKFLMPIKTRAEVRRIQEILSPIYERCKQGIQNRIFDDTSIILFYNFYNIMDLHTIPVEFSNAFEKVFERCSQKDWKYTSEQLFSLLEKILQIRLDENGNVIEGSMDLGESTSSTPSMKSIFSKITNIFKN